MQDAESWFVLTNPRIAAKLKGASIKLRLRRSNAPLPTVAPRPLACAPPRPAGPRAESAPPRALQPEHLRAASGKALLPDPPALEIADAPAPAPAEPATEGGEPAKLEAQATASAPSSLPDEEAPAGDAPGE